MQQKRPDGRALLLGLLLPLALCAAPQTTTALVGAESPRLESPAGRPLLWAIGSPAHSYLFGTMHVADPRVTTLPVVVDSAFEASDELRTEIPLDAKSLGEVARRLLLPEGQTLSDVLPEELLQRIAAFLQEQGLSLEPFSQLQPWVLASMLTVLDAGEYLQETPLDQKLYLRAQASEKAVGGLETIDEQLAIFGSLNRQEEAALVEETLEMLQGDVDYIETLIQAYLSGDAEALLNMVYEFAGEDDPLIQKYGRRLVEDRNAVMAQRIDTLVRERPTHRFFFAVGAAHLAGEDGIVQLLRDRGLVVERVDD